MCEPDVVDFGSTTKSDNAIGAEETTVASDLKNLELASIGAEHAAERLRTQFRMKPHVFDHVNDDVTNGVRDTHSETPTSRRSSPSSSSKWQIRSPKGHIISHQPKPHDGPASSSSNSNACKPNGQSHSRKSRRVNDLSSLAKQPLSSSALAIHAKTVPHPKSPPQARQQSSVPSASFTASRKRRGHQASNLIDNLSSYSIPRPVHQTDQASPRSIFGVAPKKPDPPAPNGFRFIPPRTSNPQSATKTEAAATPRKRGRPRKDVRFQSENGAKVTFNATPSPLVTQRPSFTPTTGFPPLLPRVAQPAPLATQQSSITPNPPGLGKRTGRKPGRPKGSRNRPPVAPMKNPDFDDDETWVSDADLAAVTRDQSTLASRRSRRDRAVLETTRDDATDAMPPIHFLTTPEAPDVVELLRLRELGGSSPSSKLIHRRLSHDIRERGLRPWRCLQGASKDIINAEWSPNGRNYAVSTSTELDDSSRPYNKEKNFLWGDVQSSTLTELDAHHVPKPRSETLGNRANASDDDLSTIVDDRLFTTVSSICFSADGRRMFSASYDRTVKIWSASPKRRAPKCLYTLQHEGRVEILGVQQTSQHCLVATAQSMNLGAVRVYSVPGVNGRVELANQHLYPSVRFSHNRDSKLLYPSALRWGTISSGTGHLLLGGFAEHRLDVGEHDREGDLCLWDVQRGEPYHRLSPSSQNVFDVAWHPSLPVFAAATTPGSSKDVARTTRSVVRTYHPFDSPSRVHEFECPALDMNEVKFNPVDEHYLSAACTNGKTYVWDIRMPDDILQTCEHGPCLEPLDEERSTEEADTGVRFMAWGASGTHLFTGSSDGVVKCWNPFVAEEDKHVSDIATFDSAVMSGAFSPDYSHLLIGLCKGALHMLASAPWSPNQDNDLDDDLLLQVQEFRYVSANDIQVRKRERALSVHGEPEQIPPKKVIRTDRNSKSASVHRELPRLLNGSKHLIKPRASAASASSDPIFERGVSEIDLSDCPSVSSDEGPNQQVEDLKVLSLASRSRLYESPYAAQPAGKAAEQPPKVRTATRPVSPPPLKHERASVPRTPKEARAQARGGLAPGESPTKQRGEQKPAVWKQPLPPTPPRSYLQSKRSAVVEQATRAASTGNVVCLDDSD